MKRLLLIIYLAMAAGGAQAAKQYRDFTSAEGKTIRGAIKAYDARTEMVTIERENKRTSKVLITVFSEADQAYIQEWGVLRCFMMDHYFKISAQRKRYEEASYNVQHKYLELDVDRTAYDIALENRSAFELKGLELEYCIYYEQEEQVYQQEVCNQGVYCGDISIASLAPKSEKRCWTGMVAIRKSESLGGGILLGCKDSILDGQIHGIWIRVHLKLPSGEKRTREYRLPESLNKKRDWATESVRVGAN